MRQLLRPLPLMAWAGMSVVAGAAEVGTPASAFPYPRLVAREVFHQTRPGVRTHANAFYTRAAGIGMARFASEQTQSDKADVMFRSFSSDNGETWSAAERIETVSLTPAGTRRRLLRPGLPDPDRDVLLSMVMQAVLPNDHPLEGMRHWTLGYTLSRDGGATFYHEGPVVHAGPGFDEKHPLPGVWVGSNAAMLGDTACVPIRIRTGEILVPVQISPVGPDRRYHNPGGGYTYTDAAVLIAKWNAQGLLDWELSSLAKADPGRSTRGMVEPTLAELDDGRILMVMRGSNDKKPELPGYKWFSVSKDHGRTWTEPQPWGYTDGRNFFSPSACSQLLRHSSGRLFWIGNISPTNPRANAPRYPLVIAEVDRASLQLIGESICVLDNFKEGDDPRRLTFSSFYVREDRVTRQIVVHCSPLYQLSERRDGAPPKSSGFDWTSPALLYRVDVGTGR